ncbi:MAG: fibronectin type III domain-containing protein [Mycobacteriales bacterium]
MVVPSFLSTRWLRRRLVLPGVLVSVVLGTVGFTLGHAVSPLRVHATRGAAWLPTTSHGSVSLLDGLTGRTGVELVLPGSQGHRLVVTQQGGTVLVQDTARDTIIRIDPGRLTAGPAVTAGQGTTVVAGPSATYLVNYTSGTVTRIDPVTLRATSPAYHIAGDLSRQAAVDSAGTLWLPVLSDGTVVPVTGHGPGHPITVTGGGGHSLVMTVAAGQPAVVDQTDGTVAVLRGGRAETLALPASANANATGGSRDSAGLLVPSTAPTSTVAMVATAAAAPNLVVADLAAGSARTVPLGSAVASHRLGSPVQAGARIYVPDYTTGSVLTYDSGRQALGGQIRVSGQPGQFDVQVVDGIAYFNDPRSTEAVAVTPDGQVQRIAKTGPGVPTTSGKPITATPSPAPSSPAAGSPPGHGPAGTVHPVPAQPPAGTRSGANPGPAGPAAPAAPLAPVGVRATPGAGYVDVSWQPPGSGGPISGYRVQVSPAGGGQQTLSATSVRVSGLSCATSYGFTVLSLGAGGRQVAAAPVYAHPCVAPGAVRGLTATVVHNYTREVQLSWQPVQAAAAGGVSYLVSWSSGSQTVTGTSLLVSQLLPGHSYTFTVRASDAAGTGAGASASAVPGSGNTLTVQMGQDADLLTSWRFSASVAWSAHWHDSYTAYCAYDGGDPVAGDKYWVYVENGSGHFAWANEHWLGDGDAHASLLNCRSPLVPVP